MRDVWKGLLESDKSAMDEEFDHPLLHVKEAARDDDDGQHVCHLFRHKTTQTEPNATSPQSKTSYCCEPWETQYGYNVKLFEVQFN